MTKVTLTDAEYDNIDTFTVMDGGVHLHGYIESIVANRIAEVVEGIRDLVTDLRSEAEESAPRRNTNQGQLDRTTLLWAAAELNVLADEYDGGNR